MDTKGVLTKPAGQALGLLLLLGGVFLAGWNVRGMIQPAQAAQPPPAAIVSRIDALESTTARTERTLGRLEEQMRSATEDLAVIKDRLGVGRPREVGR